ncbi:WN11B protein, partial [Centropus unirufus]|nr:WN11B protein [Centropus unirufus]
RLTESSSGVAWNESHHCRLLAGLVPDQFQMCRRNLEVMPSIIRAALQTKSVCQKTFSDMRWNCSSIQRAPSFGPDLLKGTRESAFVYALAAAAAAHSIAHACTLGELPHCSCGSIPTEVPGPDFRWGGCGDNLHYGLQLGAAFADSPLTSSKLRPQALKAMHLHNNAVGRQVGMVPTTGSYSSAHLTAAWGREVPNVRQQTPARLVQPQPQLSSNTGWHQAPVGQQPHVLLVHPPLGRQCNKTSAGSDSCNLMCCGRGYNAYTEEVVERCHCKYHWCCYVVCKKCQRKVERYVCK